MDESEEYKSMGQCRSNYCVKTVSYVLPITSFVHHCVHCVPTH